MNDRERKFQCTNCKTEVVTELPDMDIVNKPTYSVVVFVHQLAAICPSCGQGYSFFIRGFKGLEMGWMPVVIQKPDSDVIELATTIPPVSLVDLLKKRGD